MQIKSEIKMELLKGNFKGSTVISRTSQAEMPLLISLVDFMMGNKDCLIIFASVGIKIWISFLYCKMSRDLNIQDLWGCHIHLKLLTVFQGILGGFCK